MRLLVTPDPLVYKTCEWCGGWENLGLVHRPHLGNDLVCYRCYRLMFEDLGRRPVFYGR